MGKNKLAKANGLKSTFKINENEYIMTSFNESYYSKKEKGIKKSTKEIENFENNFNATFSDCNIQVEIDGGINKPVNVVLPTNISNQLDAKSAIEKIFFKNVPENGFDDNVHIQVAYKIMSIKKLFTIYVNNMVYCINNLLKVDSSKDLVGTLYTGNDLMKAKLAYDMIETGLIFKTSNNDFLIKSDVWNEYNKSLFKSLKDDFAEYDKSRFNDNNSSYLSRLKSYIKNYLGFFNYRAIKSTAESYENIAKTNLDRAGNYFSDVFADKDGNTNILYIFESIRLLSMLRQSSYHSSEFKERHVCTIFELDKYIENSDRNYIYTKKALDEIFDNKVNAINDNFVKTNKVNINIIFDIYSGKNKQQLVQNYYDFLIRKVYKNMGFSLKTLRESIIANYYGKTDNYNLEDKQFDSYRAKIYALMDFVIYNYYADSQEKIDNFIKNLRTLTVKNEEEKLKIYKKHAQSVYDDLGKYFDKIIKELEAFVKNPKNKEFTQKVSENDIDIQNPKDFTMFSKAMYCISSFLDGKEINMFLDSLINSLQNIDSFFDFAHSIEMNMDLVDSYKMFENSKQIANELKFIKSIAKMNKGKKATKKLRVDVERYQYLDVAALFGQTDAAKIETDFKLSQDAQNDKNIKYTLCNFFINNVINSNRFSYVIRFINPENAKKIMENKSIVSFAINEITDTQIVRYCKTTNVKFDIDNPDYAQMRSDIANKLIHVNYDTFSNVSNDPKKNTEKEQLKALAGLYLTVLYLIVKTLVRINVNYSIAFAIIERDFEIINKKISHSNNDSNFKKNPLYITNLFKGENKLNKEVKSLVDKNAEHFNSNIFILYRNSVEHLNVISYFASHANEITKVKSYFDLYHIMLANSVKDRLKDPENHSEFISDVNDINKYQTSGKDYLYGILSPLAYNTSRYMNLACRYRFMKSFGK